MSAHSIGFMFFKRPGQSCEQEMFARASELSRRTKGIADPLEKCRVLFPSISELYAGIPQTWAAWETHEAYRALASPYQVVTFLPDQEFTDRAKWLRERIDAQDTTMFLCPLDGGTNGSFNYYDIPKVPTAEYAARFFGAA